MAWKRKQEPVKRRRSRQGRRYSVALRHDPVVLPERKEESPDKPVPKRWSKKRQKSFEQAVDDLLLYLELSEPGKSPRGSLSYADVTPEKFLEPEILFEDLILPRTDDTGNEISFFMDVKPSDLGERFDVSVCKQKTLFGSLRPGDDEESEQSILQLFRLRRVPVRKARPHKVFSPYVAEYSQCSVFLESGTYDGAKWLVNWRGDRWMDVYKHPNPWQDKLLGHYSVDDDQDDKNYRICAGVEFTRDLIWRVVIKNPLSGLAVSLPTGRVGAMAAFRNREPNETRGRRDALRNWVKEHYRARPNDEETEEKPVHVRKHLRGRTPFRWLGFDCELVVAPFDVRLNERLRLEKENARAAKRMREPE